MHTAVMCHQRLHVARRQRKMDPTDASIDTPKIAGYLALAVMAIIAETYPRRELSWE